MASLVTLSNPHLTVQIAEMGAELFQLRDSRGRDYLWGGDAAWWSSRAPLLFPMVGLAAENRIKVKGKYYPLPNHGFAKISRFETVEASATRCVMSLVSNEETLAAWPFPFRLDVVHELRDLVLCVEATVTNIGDESLPCAFGYHHAYRWPLPGHDGEAHELVFEHAETAPIHRLVGGLRGETDLPNPLDGRRLKLDPALFDDGVLIFDPIASRKVAYGVAGQPTIEVSFPDLPHFGLWTKPGAPFVCLEPWQGFAAPVGFDGEFADRPGVVSIAPGEKQRFPMEIRVAPAE